MAYTASKGSDFKIENFVNDMLRQMDAKILVNEALTKSGVVEKFNEVVMPLVDIYETDKTFVAEIYACGYDIANRDKVSITVTNDILKIVAKKDQEPAGRTYHQRQTPAARVLEKYVKLPYSPPGDKPLNLISKTVEDGKAMLEWEKPDTTAIDLSVVADKSSHGKKL